MAQYWWTPDPADLGGAPSDWTSVVGNRGLEVKEDSSERLYLQIGGGSNTITMQTLDSVGGVSLTNLQDTEIYAEYFFDSAIEGPGNRDMRQIHRFSGPSNRTGYTFGNSSSSIEVNRFLNGGFGTLATQSGVVPTSGSQRIFTRSSSVGSAQKVRQWYNAAPEPLTWNLEVTNTEIVQTGRVGQYSYWSEYFRLYGMGIGTDGDAAPTGPLATGPNTPVNPAITNLLATSARLNWEQG